MSGAFVAVVGASGAGKDSVIGSARAALEDRRFVFPRRVITRPAGQGEDHEPVSEAEFAALEAEGGFVLSWRAHGLGYGVPIAVAGAVRDGGVAVVNISRSVLGELERHFERSAVVRISVPEELRRARIAGRGREADADIHERMSRADPAPDSAVDLEIINDRALEAAGQAFAGFLHTLARNSLGT